MVYIINLFIFVPYLTNKLITMENNEKVLTPEESLQLISRTIASIKEDFRRDNYYFILWGWVISLACILQFTMLRALISIKAYEHLNLYSWIIWGILVAIGTALGYRHRSGKDTGIIKSHTGKFFIILWQTSGVAMVLAVLISLKYHIIPGPFILTITGLATLISGRLISFKPLIYGGIAFFAFAAAASFLNNEYQLLISASAIIVGYLVPGYMLKSSKE